VQRRQSERYTSAAVRGGNSSFACSELFEYAGENAIALVRLPVYSPTKDIRVLRAGLPRAPTSSTYAAKQIDFMANTNIPSKVLAELNRQLNHELTAAHAYLAMSAWCAVRNLKGFAGFFSKQAEEEREHAEKMIQHVLDRGLAPQLAAIAAPKQDFDSLVKVAEQAQKMEQTNTQGINAVYKTALVAKDYPVQVLLHWFIKEQVEEEAWAAEMVDRVQGATCAGSLLDLDRHIEKLLGEGSGD